MAAVRSLRVSVKSDSGSERSQSDSESDRDVREAEPMEVEEGELEPDDISVSRSLKELLPVSVQDRASSDRLLAPLASVRTTTVKRHGAKRLAVVTSAVVKVYFYFYFEQAKCGTF